MQHGQFIALIQNLARLRRLAEHVEGPIATEIAAIEEDLLRVLGPTIRPADAARLLGISEPGLKRWLDKGEIASVTTPAGRREIPLKELVQLLNEAEDARAAGLARPLTHVIRRRHREAASAIDIDRLLPRPRTRTHRDAELQALAYHRLIAERLDQRAVGRARRQLEHWRASGLIHPDWASEWERVLSGSLEEIRDAISADTPHVRELRQTSPFAGGLTEQERRLLSEAVAARDTQ